MRLEASTLESRDFSDIHGNLPALEKVLGEDRPRSGRMSLCAA